MQIEAAAFSGVILATFVSAVSVSLAFMRPTLRWVSDRLRGEIGRYSDRLCVGIWMSANGAILAAASGIYKLLTTHPLFLVSALAWVMIGLGYFMHFTAWRMSFMEVEPGFPLRWAAILGAIATAGAGGAYVLIPY
jgi:hypothetical protein